MTAPFIPGHDINLLNVEAVDENGNPVPDPAVLSRWLVSKAVEVAEQIFVHADHQSEHAETAAKRALNRGFAFVTTARDMRDSLLARAAVVIAEQRENEL